MNALYKTWDFLNGKKTIIGSLLILAGKALNYFGYPEYGNPIQAIGTTFASLGLTHKAGKAANDLVVIR